MGNWISRQKPETPHQRQERLAKERGILIPPSFINHSNNSGGSNHNNNGSASLPISSRTLLLASQASKPSLLDYLWETSSGTRLLKDFMQPGISLHIPTTSITKTNQPTAPNNNIWIHLPPRTLPLDYPKDNPAMMILAAKQSLGLLNLQLLVPTTITTTNTNMATNTNDGLPSLQVSAVSPCSRFGIQARFPLGGTQQSNSPTTTSTTTDSGGWFEAKYKGRMTDRLEVVASSWMTWNNLAEAWSGHSTAFPRTNNKNQPQLNVQLGVDYEESLLAIQTQIPLSSTTLELPKLDTLLSINLNHQPHYPHPSGIDHGAEDSIPTGSSGTTNASSTPPPLWLSLKQTHHHHHQSSSSPSFSLWTLNLSQIMTFDRMHWNPLDDRAPSIRQTLGWVVQVEQQPSHNSSSTSNQLTTPSSSAPSSSLSSVVWSAGASMQWNRHVATKILWKDDNGQSLNLALVLKKWNDPSVTLTLLHTLHDTSGKARGWGIGLELEASAAAAAATAASGATVDGGKNNIDHSADYPEAPSPWSKKGGPPTKIQIPGS